MDRGRTSLVLLILLLIVVVLTFQFRSGDINSQTISINELAQELERGRVSRLVIQGNEIEVIFVDGSLALSRKEAGKSAVEQFLDLSVSPNRLDSDTVQIEIGSSLFNLGTDLPLLIGVFAAGVVVGALSILVLIRVRKSTLDE